MGAPPATAEREPVDRLGAPVRLPMCWACIAMSTTTTSPPRVAARPVTAVPYLAGLDGLRALAVVAVMVYHANPGWLPGGFIGVEVFFVISGYLITLLLIGEHERTGRVALGSFWLRRARRLLPALFVLLAGITVYTAVFRREALGQLRGDVIAALTYVSNWYQICIHAIAFCRRLPGDFRGRPPGNGDGQSRRRPFSRPPCRRGLRPAWRKALRRGKSRPCPR